MLPNTQIAIIGLGYVGLPLALRFVQSGTRVIGLDKDPKKIDLLQQGRSYIGHLESSEIRNAQADDRFIASDDFSLVTDCEAILLCVPTPLNQYREPDLQYVLNSATEIAPYLAPIGDKKKLVVLESTTYPGTTDGILRETLEQASGLTAGTDFHLAFSPEREDPGRKDHSVKTIPKLIGGLTPACRDRCDELYKIAIDQTFLVPNCRIAEAAKLTENIFRSVNIALVNELKLVYEKMDVNIWEVIEAASSKPFGYMPFYPGPGLGGHCIPIDPFYLTWKAREYDIHTKFIELAGEINTSMPDYVVGKVSQALNAHKKSVNGSRILVLGLAYKPNVDDDRESPSYVLIEKLEALGAEVFYNDPFIPEIKPTREHQHLTGRLSVPIEDNYDCLLVATHHEAYKDFDFSPYKSPVVDTRNCLKHRPKAYYLA
ncbi:MAG: nucleotide sugar dehydrogenase [Opitutales bacterium]|nr:nucleotide sugar dehydrogenase [Opitutales bacterium]MCH8539603.1 nucleotide sugar dehydrogenase [Opitutales bacterium]